MNVEQQTDQQGVTPVSREIEHQILRALRSIRFGSVEIVIQDGKIIQIERREKVRFGR